MNNNKDMEILEFDEQKYIEKVNAENLEELSDDKNAVQAVTVSKNISDIIPPQKIKAKQIK